MATLSEAEVEAILLDQLDELNLRGVAIIEETVVRDDCCSNCPIQRGQSSMKLPVPNRNAMLLGNGLIAHVRTVQEAIRKTGKLPQRRYLTYTQLIEASGARVIPRGIGQHLDHVMDAIHAPGVPEKMRGLTLFVTDVSGAIDFSGDRWFEITAQNSQRYRQDVLALDWSEVEFVSLVPE